MPETPNIDELFNQLGNHNEESEPSANILMNDSYLRSEVPNYPGKFVAGAELEIENIRLYNPIKGIKVVEDGSLRNFGKEFLLPPRERQDLAHLFDLVHEDISIYHRDKKFSARTSTHVHVNVIGCSKYMIKSLLYLYAIFEPLAFAFVGDRRKNNIHCVPLYMTYMPNLYSEGVEDIASRWLQRGFVPGLGLRLRKGFFLLGRQQFRGRAGRF